MSTEGQSLPLGKTRIETEAQGGIARVKLVQTFVNTGPEPLRVSYLLPLPEKAAVSGFSFELDGHLTRGVVQRREEARANFEQALLEGRSAAILEEESSTLFRQEVGNVPPGAEIVVTVEVDQMLSWHAAAGAWEWRFPTVVAPRYQGTEVTDVEAERVKVHVADLPAIEHLGTRASLDLRIRDERSGEVTSPSHRFLATDHGSFSSGEAARGTSVSFLDAEGEGGGGVPLDRDIVLRWPVGAAAPGVSLSIESASVGDSTGLFGLITLVPPTRPTRTIPRDLIVLLDTSGSMSGEPLAQAVEVVSALIDSLGEHDRLELLEFSSSVTRWKRGARAATPRSRSSAKRWLGSLRASGSTDMHSAIRESLSLLGDESQRQVLVVTDGLIGGEQSLVRDIAKALPAACRVHTLGIGHGVNRTLTAGAARAGRGVEQIVAPGEDPKKAKEELLASMNQPVLVDLRVSGDAIRESSSGAMDVYAATPSLIPVRLEKDAEGRATGPIVIEGRTAEGTWRRTLETGGVGAGSGANAALFARERVQQLETFDAVERSGAEIDAEVERLGLDYQIATRRTSWVAVSRVRSVDPNEPTRSVEMPHELGAGLSAEGLGLRAPTGLVMGADAYGGEVSLVALAPKSAPAAAPPLGSTFRAKASRARKLKRPFQRDQSAMADGAGDLDSAAHAPKEEGHEDSPEVKKERTLELVARVLIDREGRLVISFEAPEDLIWVDLLPITVEFEDGSVQTVTLESTGSTAGPVAKGAEIRMVLSGLPESASAPAVRVFTSGPCTFRLNLKK